MLIWTVGSWVGSHITMAMPSAFLVWHAKGTWLWYGIGIGALLSMGGVEMSRMPRAGRCNPQIIVLEQKRREEFDVWVARSGNVT